MNTQDKHSPNDSLCKEQQSEDTKYFRLLALSKGLAKCNPVSEKLLLRLYGRIGINLN